MKTLYYDIETDSQFAPYAKLTVIGFRWSNGFVEEFNFPETFENEINLAYIRETLADTSIRRVGFNCCNFDDLVLYRYNFPVAELNREDAYLAVKTLHPEFPSFSLKFLNWWIFGDFHLPEYALEASQAAAKKKKFGDASDPKLMSDYNRHDLLQHQRIWEWCEEKLIDRALEAYNLDKSQGKVIEQMIFKGGLHIDKKACEKALSLLSRARERNVKQADKISQGRVRNANSSMQLGTYFDAEGFELELTDKGAFQVNKKTIDFLWRLSPVAKCVKNIRKIDSILKYYKNYLKALADETFSETKKEGYIPTSFSISGARTRRYTSSSKFGLNFQNPNEAARRVQLVPPGWLGFWIDATQVENIVHIFESNDLARRIAYEEDENWSEYVWLCNEILGTNLSKKKLDSIKSKQNENWSVYKQYKTIKLMMNFGAGVKKFCDTAGFSLEAGKILFNDIHKACPAIKQLQTRVKQDIENFGEVYDPFGHVYRGSPDMAYKIVAYLIQGCGTASLPKAQLRANYDTCQKYNDLYTTDVALLCGTTHDETAGRIDKSIGAEQIQNILTELMYNMTKRFEHKFDNIPLRAKLYLSETNNAGRVECTSFGDYCYKAQPWK